MDALKYVRVFENFQKHFELRQEKRHYSSMKRVKNCVLQIATLPVCIYPDKFFSMEWSEDDLLRRYFSFSAKW